MELREHDSADSFLAAASLLLSADEARHNLAFGICHTLTTAPERYQVAHLWTVEDGSEVVAAALMTPPWNLFVVRPQLPDALEFLAEELADGGPSFPASPAPFPSRMTSPRHGSVAPQFARVSEAAMGSTRFTT